MKSDKHTDNKDHIWCLYMEQNTIAVIISIFRIMIVCGFCINYYQSLRRQTVLLFDFNPINKMDCLRVCACCVCISDGQGNLSQIEVPQIVFDWSKTSASSTDFRIFYQISFLCYVLIVFVLFCIFQIFIDFYRSNSI